MDRQYSGLTKVAMGVLTFNSVLAVYNSWGDANSVLFVLAADAILVLLFLCLRELELERAAGRGRVVRTRAAVWTLTTLLSAMFASQDASGAGLPASPLNPPRKTGPLDNCKPT
jgi:hypothetical protein